MRSNLLALEYSVAINSPAYVMAFRCGSGNVGKINIRKGIVSDVMTKEVGA